MLFLRKNHRLSKKNKSIYSTVGQAMNELFIVVIASSVLLFVIGTLIHRSISANVRTLEDTLEESNNAIKAQDAIPLARMPDCTCTPPQGASGWRCGTSPCEFTERLITTTCIPSGCGAALGIKEEECVEDSECCDEFKDSNFCGTGGSTPDCPIGERIVQKTCGKDVVIHECRPDTEGVEADHNPSCKPRCLGRYSPNEAAAIVNPSLPVICPSDDTDLELSHGPWTREKSGVGIESKILGNGVTACNHPPSPMPDQKCELYCLNGYRPNADGLTCEPISCTQGPAALKTVVANEELYEGSTQTYSYSIPSSCPVEDENSYIMFNVTLGEATLQVWNNSGQNWETLSTSGDNNNLFHSLKLYPLGNDSKYFADGQIKWQVSQASGDKDSFFVLISAVECNQPPIPQNIPIQTIHDVLTNGSNVIRSFSIPAECEPINESSYFSVNLHVVNAALEVYDVNANMWSEIANSGPNNQQLLSLNYHPLGFESRFFKNNEIMWRISKTQGSHADYQAGITVTDCDVNMCSGAPKEGWITILGSTNSCEGLCASVGLKPGISPEGMSCASGENRPMSGTGKISYLYKCTGGLGCNGNLAGPTQTHLSDVNCYRNGQNEDGRPTDMMVACYCGL